MKREVMTCFSSVVKVSLERALKCIVEMRSCQLCHTFRSFSIKHSSPYKDLLSVCCFSCWLRVSQGIMQTSSLLRSRPFTEEKTSR